MSEQRRPILILEDNDEWRLLLTMVLTKRGLQVVGLAGDPGPAYAWSQYGLVLCDWMMGSGGDPVWLLRRSLLPLDPAERPAFAVMSVLEERKLQLVLEPLRAETGLPIPYVDKTWPMARLVNAIRDCV